MPHNMLWIRLTLAHKAGIITTMKSRIVKIVSLTLMVVVLFGMTAPFALANRNQVGAERQYRLNPLTGLPIAENMSSRRPLAISIGNTAGALPINGISRADIVYEVPVYTYYTRFVALFQDIENMPLVGSIRSARPYIASISRSHDAILVSVGQCFVSRDEIERYGIAHINYLESNSEQTGHRRMFNRNANRIPSRTLTALEHTAVTSGELAMRHMPDFFSRLNHYEGFNNRLSFVGNATPFGGSPANTVTINFSSTKTSTFILNESASAYYMHQTIHSFNAYLVDANNGVYPTFTNLLILRTDVGTSTHDRALLDVRTVGNGTGYFVNGGSKAEINWSRANEDSPFIYTLRNGSPLNLGRGTTYVAIVPMNAVVNFGSERTLREESHREPSPIVSAASGAGATDVPSDTTNEASTENETASARTRTSPDIFHAANASAPQAPVPQETPLPAGMQVMLQARARRELSFGSATGEPATPTLQSTPDIVSTRAATLEHLPPLTLSPMLISDSSVITQTNSPIWVLVIILGIILVVVLSVVVPVYLTVIRIKRKLIPNNER